MVDYRRMGIMEEHMLNTTSTVSLNQLTDLWESPRGTVLRIQASTMVAIIFSFFLASYGSCRRWSNSWIVQKGFFVAQGLSLSLGTYSIGLMQSTSVMSEMYPIWTVSLFILFGCIDPVTTYNGLDYKGQLSKVVYGICLYCGYVLLMSISTMSTVVGKTAICMLSAITFIKGFHRSFALVQQRRMRNNVQSLLDLKTHGYVLKNNPKIHRIERDSMIVSFGTGIDGSKGRISLEQLEDALFFLQPQGNTDMWLRSCIRSYYDVCVAMSLSHHLQRHVLGLGYRKPRPEMLKGTKYKWALEVIEIELALVYDYLYTGNSFIHYYQAKTASLWALASFIGICFVGVAVAIPETMSSLHHTTSGVGSGDYCTNVVKTTTADLLVTFVILVFLALLQLMQLIRSWTSNWARVAVASAYATNKKKIIWSDGAYKTPWWWPRWMRLKASVATSSNWFDKYLWQDKIGQYSVLPEGRLTAGKNGEGSRSGKECKLAVSTSTTSMIAGKKGEGCSSRKEYESPVSRCAGKNGEGGSNRSSSTKQKEHESPVSSSTTSMTAGKNGEGGSSSSGSSRKEDKSIVRRLASIVRFLYKKCVRLVMTLGLDYIWEVLWDLLGSDANKRPAVRLDEGVKKSIVDFLSQIETDILDGNWLSFSKKLPSMESFVPLERHGYFPSRNTVEDLHGYKYTKFVMKLHIVTWYCELAEQELEEKDGSTKVEDRNFHQKKVEDRNRHVANALSKYCAYLAESAPELLPPPAMATKRASDDFKKAARIVFGKDNDRWFFFGKRKKNKDRFLGGVLSDPETWKNTKWREEKHEDPGFEAALKLAKELLGVSDGGSLHDIEDRSELWETLALAWVRILVYAAPYGTVETHTRRLSQGGEFITHLWTLLYHLDIHGWKPSDDQPSFTTRKPSADVPKITSIDDAATVLAVCDMAVVAFLSSPSGSHSYSDELVTASKLEPGVRFYQTSSPDVAKIFHIDPAARDCALIFLNKGAEQKFTLYNGEFRAYDIAYFVATAKSLALDKIRAQGTAPTIVDNTIKKQSLDDGGQTEDQSSADGHEEITPVQS